MTSKYAPNSRPALDRMSDSDENGDMMSDGSYFQHRDRINQQDDGLPEGMCRRCYSLNPADCTCEADRAERQADRADRKAMGLEY